MDGSRWAKITMIGWLWFSMSSTKATDFSRPTSNGATAPGNSTALRIGRSGISSREIHFLLVEIWCELFVCVAHDVPFGRPQRATTMAGLSSNGSAKHVLAPRR